jgi:FtsZ-binding cell division protein ZapB
MSDMEKMMQLITILIQRIDILGANIDDLKESNKKLENKIVYLAARAGCAI